jgi:outer membrane protein, adhesin transport system
MFILNAFFSQMPITPYRYFIAFMLLAFVSYARSADESNVREISAIEGLLALAVSTHPSVFAKLSELKGSGFIVDVAQWQHYPSFLVQTERNTSQSTFTSPAGSTTIRVQQNLWTGGRIEAGVRSAQFKQLAAKNALLETRNTVAMKTLEAWQGYLTSIGRQQATKQLLAQLERLRGMINRRVEYEVSPAIDEQLIRARIAQANSEYLAALNNSEMAKQQLTQWIGDNAPELEKLSNATFNSLFVTPTFPTSDLAKILSDRVSISPTLTRLDADINSASQEIEQKKAERWPTVYARIERQFGRGSFGGKSTDTFAYLGLQFAPGAGLTASVQIESALTKLQALESEREASKRQLAETYQSEWREYRSATDRIKYAQQVRQSNSALFESYTRLFVSGKRTWLELLNSLREQASGEIAFTDLQSLQQTSFFRLQVYLNAMPWQKDPEM